MKYIDEYRDKTLVEKLSRQIHERVTRKWNIMEICGGQTHAIMKYGLTQFLPPDITLVHGPGCPVCVTPLERIDSALAIAGLSDVIFTSYGDMMRVPGSHGDLLGARAGGADVRMVYSPLDAVDIARSNPGKKVVFFAIGFETTAPVNALSVVKAARTKTRNFFLLASHVLVPPAMELILSDKESNINGFLAAGHVCTVMGYRQYFSIAENYKTPITVTGFEPVDIMKGILANISQLERGSSSVENAYERVVTEEGNLKAQNTIDEIFEVSDQEWRGIGTIPLSGLKIRKNYAGFDAEMAFDITAEPTIEQEICIAGEILRGRKSPVECGAFGKECTPGNPLGAPMVSAEGTCSAYYKYKNA